MEEKHAAYLYITGPPVKIEVEVLDVSVFCEKICDVFFRGFFVNVCCYYDPTFDTTYGDGILDRLGFCAGGGLLGSGRAWSVLILLICWRFGVDFHFVRHDGGGRARRAGLRR